MPFPVSVKDLVEYLQGFGVEDALIPLLIMTASFESGLSGDTIGENKNGTKDYGVYQVNVASFYDDKGIADPTIQTFFKKIGKKYTRKEFTNLINNNEKFASQFVAHYIDRLTKYPEAFDTGGDPLTKWNAYKDYVVTFVNGDRIEGRDNESVINAVGAYVDSYMQIKAKEMKELFKFKDSEIKGITNNNG